MERLREISKKYCQNRKKIDKVREAAAEMKYNSSNEIDRRKL